MIQREHFEAQVLLLDFISNRKGISKNSRILDAACGTGDVVLEHNKKGFNKVSALDGSEVMLEQFPAKSLPFSVECCNWKSLGKYFDRYGQFDFIYILGNSFPHLEIESIPRCWLNSSRIRLLIRSTSSVSSPITKMV